MLSLFDRVVRETGLAQIIARGVVTRACLRAGISEPENLRPREIETVAPAIERMLQLYLDNKEALVRISRIRGLAADNGYDLFVLDDPSLDD